MTCEELLCGTSEWGTGTKVAFSFSLSLSFPFLERGKCYGHSLP